MGVRIKKNDKVYVRSGSSKGETGSVLKVLPKEGKALVKGVNMVKCHERPRGQGQPGGIVEKEAALPLCVLMPIGPDGKPGRVRFEEREGKDGKKVKVRIHIPSGSEF